MKAISVGRYARGFSLMEMMIVALIIGVLTAIMYPAYENNVLRGRRIADGLKTINAMMEAQERNFFNNLSYTVDLTQVGYAAANNVSSPDGHYLITATVCTDGSPITQCVLLTATPQGQQVNEMDTIAPQDPLRPNLILTLNSRGTKTGMWE